MSMQLSACATSSETETDPLAERLVIALHLANQVYGVDVACVHTVITPQPITPVPKAPPAVQGVINLRGRILPVLDLRARFGLPPRDEAEPRGVRIVIVETEGLTAGLIVDAVSEVLRLPAGSVFPPSHLVLSAETECLQGIARLSAGRRANDPGEAQDRLILLLDVAKTLAIRPQDDAALRQLQVSV